MSDAARPDRTVLAAPRFLKAKRRLPEAAQNEVDAQIRTVLTDPLRGESKSGALRGVRVVKFTVEQQRHLLAYRFLSNKIAIEVLDVGPHENFDRDLQKHLDAR
jgi:mRNA-degrading endonuclease RelE of RelBE toxin-antitoxin system